jgi:alkyl hydroperoxide reductase subunit F
MPTFLNAAARQEVKKRLSALAAPVRLVYFTSPHACGACAEQRALLEELAALGDGKLLLSVHEFPDAEAVKRYGIDKVPATVVAGERDVGIRFFGLTGGYEFGSLLEAIRMVSSGEAGLDPAIAASARRLRAPLHLEILVTLTCPYCPRMVHLAHQLALVNEHIRADMVDAAEFPALANRYRVRGVPLTVVNERPAFEGALPPEQALMEILRIADPDEYERLEALARAARGERLAIAARAEEIYDVIVVGAGPAGITAALYAVRKGRRVALIGKKAGGQVNDTAVIENYPAFVHVGGSELAELLRHHLEAYPVAERCHTEVTEIRRAGDLFEALTEDGARYRARALIYAAGKRYRRLEVPGEERFLGRGIAFCATCDAPLYRDKRVAVVGGGNSALTAVRDLLPYAREIHLIHLLDRFQADAVLIEEVRRAPQVRVHFKTEVREFLGDSELRGLRLAATGGQEYHDLAVEGVFLEIGLVPNSRPLAALVPLNAAGEVPVGRDQSTAVPGLFAAGDVTDEPDKQIVIAAGSGARAALAAERYLAVRQSAGAARA